MIRVVLVDDQELMREGLSTILSAHADLEIVGQAANGLLALDVVRQTRPDVVCMDVQMPVMDGLEATRELTADATVCARVLILTTFEREDYLLAALDAGAGGFLLKNSRPEQLADGIRTVASGDALIAPELTRSLIERALQDGTRTDPPTPEVEQLTERELEVLGLIADGLSNDEIAEALFLGRATVKTHVSNLLSKLQLRDRVQAVVFAHRHGLAR